MTGIWGPISAILGDPGAVSRDDTMLVVFTVRSSDRARLDLTVNFHHEHCIVPTNYPRVSEDEYLLDYVPFYCEFWIRFSYVMMTSIEVSMFLGAKYFWNE